MNEVLDKKIEDVLDSADRMFIATSVGGNSSGASVFYARDGEDLVFFTFNPTRKHQSTADDIEIKKCLRLFFTS